MQVSLLRSIFGGMSATAVAKTEIANRINFANYSTISAKKKQQKQQILHSRPTVHCALAGWIWICLIFEAHACLECCAVCVAYWCRAHCSVRFDRQLAHGGRAGDTKPKPASHVSFQMHRREQRRSTPAITPRRHCTRCQILTCSARRTMQHFYVRPMQGESTTKQNSSILQNWKSIHTVLYIYIVWHYCRRHSTQMQCNRWHVQLL